jgi:hypothetical protein
VNRFTRRRFVERGAAVAGAASATALVGGSRLADALAASTGGLTEARRTTYAAVVEAMALVKGSSIKATALPSTTARFAKLYSSGAPGFRQGVDRILDRVEAGPGGAGFAKLDARGRLDLLRKWTRSRRGSIDGMHAGAVATTAALYAAMPFEPRAADDPRTVAVQL